MVEVLRFCTHGNHGDGPLIGPLVARSLGGPQSWSAPPVAGGSGTRSGHTGQHQNPGGPGGPERRERPMTPEWLASRPCTTRGPAAPIQARCSSVWLVDAGHFPWQPALRFLACARWILILGCL